MFHLRRNLAIAYLRCMHILALADRRQNSVNHANRQAQTDNRQSGNTDTQRAEGKDDHPENDDTFSLTGTLESETGTDDSCYEVLNDCTGNNETSTGRMDSMSGRLTFSTETIDSMTDSSELLNMMYLESDWGEHEEKEMFDRLERAAESGIFTSNSLSLNELVALQAEMNAICKQSDMRQLYVSLFRLISRNGTEGTRSTEDAENVECRKLLRDWFTDLHCDLDAAVEQFFLPISENNMTITTKKYAEVDAEMRAFFRSRAVAQENPPNVLDMMMPIIRTKRLFFFFMKKFQEMVDSYKCSNPYDRFFQ